MSSFDSDTSSRLPPIDERIVAPGSGHEIVDGVLVRVAPSDERQGTCKARITYVLGAHLAADYTIAIDMLSRTSPIDDIAPDVSLFPRKRDPVTGGRLIEELAFEVVAAEALAEAGMRATKLATRGVRRVFAVDVDGERVFEWSRESGAWSIVDTRSQVNDIVFAVPLPVEALLSARPGGAVLRALIATNNPVIVRQLELTAPYVQGILAVLEARGLIPTSEQRDRLCHELGLGRVKTWLAIAATCTSIEHLLDTQ